MINETMIQKQDEIEVKGALTLADNLIKQYQSVGITNNKDNGIAGAFLKDVRTKYKVLNEKRLELTRPITAAKKVIDDFFNAPLAKLKSADDIISKATSDFWLEQELIRKAEEAKIKAEADAEARKLEVRAEKVKTPEKAEELRQKAADIQATVPVVESKVEKVQGVGMRVYYHADVIDETKVPREFLSVDEKKLQKFADAMKGNGKVEGVKFWSETKPVMTR